MVNPCSVTSSGRRPAVLAEDPATPIAALDPPGRRWDHVGRLTGSALLDPLVWPWSVGTVLSVRGRVLLALDEVARAEEVLRRSAVVLGRLRDRGAMMYALTFLAVAAALRSDARRAALLFGAADRLVARTGAAQQGRYREIAERGRDVDAR